MVEILRVPVGIEGRVTCDPDEYAPGKLNNGAALCRERGNWRVKWAGGRTDGEGVGGAGGSVGSSAR